MLTERKGDTIEFDAKGLNPCFNGICSLSLGILVEKDKRFCLNPCFNGICSLSRYISVLDDKTLLVS